MIAGSVVSFCRGERITDVINGTELRAVGVDVIAIGVYPAEAGLYDPGSLIKLELSHSDEAEALTCYR